MLIFAKECYDDLINSINIIVDLTEYITVNIKSPFIYVILQYHQLVCNALLLDDLTDNKIIQTRHV